MLEGQNRDKWAHLPDPDYEWPDGASNDFVAVIEEIGIQHPDAELLHERGDGKNFDLRLPDGMSDKDRRDAVAFGRKVFDDHGFGDWNVYDYGDEESGLEYINGNKPHEKSDEQKSRENWRRNYNAAEQAAWNGDIEIFKQCVAVIGSSYLYPGGGGYSPMLDLFKDPEVATHVHSVVGNPRQDYSHGDSFGGISWSDWMNSKRLDRVERARPLLQDERVREELCQEKPVINSLIIDDFNAEKSEDATLLDLIDWIFERGGDVRRDHAGGHIEKAYARAYA